MGPVGIAVAKKALGKNQAPKRERPHLSGRAILALGMVGAAFVATRGCEAGSVAHPDIKAQANSALKKVTLPNKAILVEGTGTSSADINIRVKSDVPVAGWLWNHTAANFTDMTDSAPRQGKVQLGTKQKAITLSTYRLPKNQHSANSLGLGIKASVDADKLFVQTADMDYTDGGARHHDDIIPRFAELVGMDTQIAQRIGSATVLADRSFKNACGNALIPDIPAGVQKHVKADVLSSAQLLDAAPKGGNSANMLRKLAKAPVEVDFYKTDRSGKPQPVNVSQISLEQDYIPSPQSLPSGVSVNTGAKDCMFTGNALEQQERILAQSNGATSVTR